MAESQAMFNDAGLLYRQERIDSERVRPVLQKVGFADWEKAHERLVSLCSGPGCREALSDSLPMLFVSLSDAATPDGSLINFERFAQSVDNREQLFRYLATNPRAVEILVKLFVGSQFLTEILLRNPDYLERLTNHRRVAEFKSQQDFYAEAADAAAKCNGIPAKLNALRRYQHWELLRIGACDSFGLMDLKSVTVQLSLLGDSLVQCCLDILAEDMKIDTEGFAVLAFGKMGGEELNYSSDIDLVFLSRSDATRFWPLGQRLIKSLMESTGEGFLYRVDMRLRPWGRSGSLVNTVEAHVKYLQQHGMAWEKQALIKARTIAGDRSVGKEFLKLVEPLVYSMPVDVIRRNIREMKEKIEANLARKGKKWGEVKSGEGSIRDIEFVTQGLQLIHGGENRHVRSINTLDALVRLADLGYLPADEYRQLASGYVFLRTIEHSLQLMHHKQTHSLPEDDRELAYLARRLDYPGGAEFLAHYEQHCETIRAIYDRHIGGEERAAEPQVQSLESLAAEHAQQMEPSYSHLFSEDEIKQHVKLVRKLSDENLAEVEAQPADGLLWRLTVAGLDLPGDLSIICGLLFVFGFDIVDGQVFTAEQMSSTVLPSSAGALRRPGARTFVNVFTIRPPLETVLPDVWKRYRDDLNELLHMIKAGQQREAQGALAKRVGVALRTVAEDKTSLLPVDVRIDNTSSEKYTALHIRAEDTIGFLYELSNALTLAGVNIVRVIVKSIGPQVMDTLYVTDFGGAKITDPTREQELRAAVVLIKHFTHLLPRSPNPEQALLHFRAFLEQLFQQPNWPQELASLERPDVLDALAKLLGVSNFLWEDFLRLQHANLFPIVTDIERLAERKSRVVLEAELLDELREAKDTESRRAVLNAFKDREMFRTDMRHILGYIPEFGQFSAELTDVSEVVVTGALEICVSDLQSRYGRPRLADERPCPLSVCALGKCGGRELGFASDIELMFVFEDNGRTTGPETITTAEYHQKLVEAFNQTIQARREGIFEIDLRLRPYGRAGSLAVSLDAFRSYFGPGGAAWPYERQALVKLRPIAGDPAFGRVLTGLRDEFIYSGEAFDVTSMRAMREKQVNQLVQAGTFNAKLSPGGLVDCEYLVQGLQITHGHRYPELRTTNTREAIGVLREVGILSQDAHDRLIDAYRFLRRLIDALRVVRGHARDLTVPAVDTEEFEFLARRLNYGHDLAQLKDDIEQHRQAVQELTQILPSGTPAGSSSK